MLRRLGRLCAVLLAAAIPLSAGADNLPLLGVSGGGAPCTYYVDSVAGSDSNAGTTIGSPFADFQYFINNTVPNGTVICLKRGSYFTGANADLIIGVPGSLVNNVTVKAYGTGANPIIDASDAISPSCWSLVASNTYSCTVTGPGTSWATPYGSWSINGPFIELFECKTAPCTPVAAAGNDTFLANETSLSTVESTPGSYYIASMTSTSLTIDYQASDSSNPGTNGYTVTYSHRPNGIALIGLNNRIVSVTAKKNADLSGTCNLENGNDGGSPNLQDIECDQGSKHNLIVPSGAYVANSRLYDAYCPSNVCGGFGNMFVAFDQTAQNLPIALSNVFFYNSTGLSGSSITAVYAHTGSGTMGAFSLSGGEMKAVGGGAFGGAEVDDTSSVAYSNFVCNQLANCLTLDTSLTVSGVQAVSSVTNNTQITVNASNVTLSFSGLKLCASNMSNGAVWMSGNTGITISDTGSLYYVASPNSNTQVVFNSTATSAASTLTANGDTFDGAVNFIAPYGLGGTGWSFAGGATAATANSYVAADQVNRWELNGSTYTSLAAWQAAVAPQDSAALATGSASAACTLPSWAMAPANDNRLMRKTA